MGIDVLEDISLVLSLISFDVLRKSSISFDKQERGLGKGVILSSQDY
jgi:hypothetical protein